MKKLFFLLILVLSYISINDCQAQALVKYAKQGNSIKVQELLDKGVDTTAINIALFEAAKEGYTDIIKVLIEKGANINTINHLPASKDWALTPIGIAAWYGRFDAIKLLVENGANVNVGSIRPLTSSLFSKYSVWTHQEYNLEIIKFLLVNGADPNYYNKELKPLPLGKDIPPLCWAVWNIEIVKLLIEYGADVNGEDLLGDNAIIYALKNAINPDPDEYDLKYIRAARYLFSKSDDSLQNKAILIFDESSFGGASEMPDTLDIIEGKIKRYITPGNYSIGVHCNPSSGSYTYYGFSKVSFVAKAGYAYFVRSKLEGISSLRSRVDEIDLH